MDAVKMTENIDKVYLPDKQYFKIGEAAELLGLKPHVLRYWESEFPQIKPQKSPSGQRLYKRKDVELLCEIRSLLYNSKFTIAGARSAVINYDNKLSQVSKQKEQIPTISDEKTNIINQLKDDLTTIKRDLQSIIFKL